MNKHAKRTRKKMQRALHPYMSWNVQNFLCRSRCDEGLAPLHEIDKISKNLYLGPKSSHFQTISSKKQHVTAFSAKSYTTHIFRPCDRSYNDIFHNFPYQVWMPPHTPNNKNWWFSQHSLIFQDLFKWWNIKISSSDDKLVLILIHQNGRHQVYLAVDQLKKS